ncbi:Androglobin [Schistosoma japonicum]|nr:Androglobin [Schistosoma japonicum]
MKRNEKLLKIEQIETNEKLEHRDVTNKGTNLKIPETLIFTSCKNTVSSLASLIPSEPKEEISLKLRQFGFQYTDSYPICIAKRRTIPIIAPTPVQPIPKWKASLPTSTSESAYTSCSSPDTGKQSSGTIKLRSNSQVSPTRRRRESNSYNISSSKSQKRGSREDIQKKGTTNKLKEIKVQNKTNETIAGSGQNSNSHLNNSIHRRTITDDIVMDTSIKTISVINPKEIWIDIEEFCEVFKTVDIYHKPNTYSIVKTHSNLKPSDQSSVHYLFCDSIQPCEMIIQLSVIYQWPLPVVKRLTPTTNSRGFTYIPETEESLTIPNNELESYHWNQSKQGDPIKRLETTGNSSISLLLPFSRHCYKLIINAPLGYVITILGRVHSSFTTNEQINKLSSSLKGVQSVNILFGDNDYILTNGISTCPILIKYYANYLINSMFAIGQGLETLIHLTEIHNQQIHETLNTTNNNNNSSIINNLESYQQEFKEKFTNALTSLNSKQEELKQLLSIWPNQQVIKPTLLSIIQRLTEDSSTPDMNYAWRILQTDFTTINPFRVKYSHGVEKPSQSVKVNTIEETFINRWNQPIDPDILVAIVRIQSLFRGYRIRNAKQFNQIQHIIDILLSIINSQYNNDKLKIDHFMNKLSLFKIKRLSIGWMTCLNALQQGQHQFEAGNEIITKLIFTNSITMNNFSIQSKLCKDLNLYLSIKEYTGTYSDMSSSYPMHNTGPELDNIDKLCNPLHNDWIHLLFRDCIYPSTTLKYTFIGQEEFKYSIHMKTTTLSDSYILLINNDNGVTIRPSIEFPYTWFNLLENIQGYTLLGLVNENAVPSSSGKWSLQLLGPGANNESLITIHLRLSVPNVFTRICIKLGNKEMRSAEGYGGACIFAYLLLTDLVTDEKESSTLNSIRQLETNKMDNVKLNLKDANNSKITTNKLNTVKVSPRRSATIKKNVKPGSSSGSSTGNTSTIGSGGGSSSINSANNERRHPSALPNTTSPHIHSLDSQQSEEERHYWIEAYVDSKCWPLSISNWAFLEEQRYAKLEECQVNNNTTRSNSADKSSDSKTVKSASKSPGNKAVVPNQKSGSGRATSAKIDYNQAHWKMRIICNNSNDIKVINMDNKILEIKAMKRAWEEMEPGRAIRGELSRTRYLEENGLMNKSDVKSSNDDTESVITIKSDDSQIQSIKETLSIESSIDPSKIYVITFPHELNRTIYSIKNIDLNKFYRNFNQIELNRIKEAQYLIDVHTDQWFIVQDYFKQINYQLSFIDYNQLIKIKREIFNEFMKNLENQLINNKKQCNKEKYDHIYLNDEAHYKYYETCMTYRNNLIKQYKAEKDTLLNSTTIESVAESNISVVTMQQLENVKKSERLKSSKSSKSSSKSRLSSNKQKG